MFAIVFSSCLRGTLRVSNVCDDGTFMFPKECRKAQCLHCKGLYSTAVFNLCTVVFYSSSSLSFLFFSCRRKEAKGSAQSKNSRNVLCSGIASNILWSNIACRSSLFVSVQALRDLCGYSVIKKKITLPHFKHFLAYSWTETGFHSIFNSAVILEITYACGKPRTMVISNISKRNCPSF